jgi:hypothetical protein
VTALKLPGGPGPGAFSVKLSRQIMTTEHGPADVFISHAHEDKEVARPLAEALRQRGLTVWYDEYVLRLGDSLREVIERGLASSRFGVVILSPSFFAKEWPQRELNALLARETTKRSKVLLPVWHNLTLEEVTARTPILADRLAVSTARGFPFIVEQILAVLDADKPPSAAAVSPPAPPPPIRKAQPSPRAQPAPRKAAASSVRKETRIGLERPAIAALIAATMLVAGVLLWRPWRSSSAPNPSSSTPATSTGTSTAGVEGLHFCGEEQRSEGGILFVRICPGTFTMGSTENAPYALSVEQPAHQVTLSEFWLSKTEITNEFFGDRLPTEAEWEYAARAGSHTVWSFGDDKKGLDDYAWHGGNSGGTPHPVGTKKPNAWGLLDMYGNVGEWVADWYGPYTWAAQTDPSGPATGENRVVRGGTFVKFLGIWFLRSADRGWVGPANQGSSDIGFRCARGQRRQP